MPNDISARSVRHSNKHEAATQEAAQTTEQTTPQAVATPVYLTDTAKIADMEITLSSDIYPGMILSETDAKILLAALVRQFTNNQNALAKARAEKFAAAKTDDERTAYAPLTAEQIAAKFVGYRPSIGDAPRQSAVEKLRYEAAWRAWVGIVTEHNKLIDAGEQGLIVKAAGRKAPLMASPVKTKAISADAHAAALKAFDEAKTAFLTNLLAAPAYADRVQEAMDAIVAERANKGTKAAPAVDAAQVSMSLI